MGNGQYHFGNVYGPVHAGQGDQYVAGRDQTIGAPPQVLADLDQLRRLLDELRLTGTERKAADQELAAAEAAVRRPEPDRAAAGSHLTRFVRGLTEAGALATAGTAFVQSIHALATWLGPAAGALLTLL
jgi:hypothetical protein